MHDSVQQMVTAVIDEGGFDATPTRVLDWLNARHRTMVGRSKCYRRTLEWTGDGTREYGFGGLHVVEVYDVRVADSAYVPGVHRDIAAAESTSGTLVIRGAGLWVGIDEALWLYPEPAPGAAVQAWVALMPDDLALADDTTIKVDPDFTDALVAGAIATGLMRQEHRPDLAAAHEQVFVSACEELRQRTNRKYRGTGPATIRFQS